MSMGETANVEVADPPDVPLPAELDGDVVVLPREVESDGRGLYSDTAVGIVKEFRAEGVSARYQHDQGERSWVGEKALAEVAIALVIGIASNAGWAALCRIVRREHGADRVSIRVGRLRKTRKETSWEWYKIEGSGRAVADALTAIEAPSDEGARAEQEAKKGSIEPP